MRTECLPLDRIPHLSRLFLDYLQSFDQVAQYYPAPPFQIPIHEQFQLLSQDYPATRRQAVTAILLRQNRAWGGGERALANLERLGTGAAAVVTGQQVSLFGGPLFSVLKAITAIKRARELTESGMECVPIFWMATEDHDVAEVSSFHYRVDGEVRSVSTVPEAVQGAPVGNAKLPAEITNALHQFARDLGDSQILDLLRECYKPGARLGDAFARLFIRLFAEYGLILMDANDAELHQIAGPFFQRAVEQVESTTKELLQRSKQLESSGYDAQVKVTSASTNLFLVRNGARHAIHRSNGGYAAGSQKVSQQELLRIAEREPESLSAGALLRPAMQDYLLPTLMYIGGPAEIAYFAQSEVLYRNLLGRVTPIVPRISATLIEKNVERKLERFQLQPADLFGSAEQTRQLLAERSLPSTLGEHMDAVKQRITELTSGLQNEILKLDPTLLDAASRASSKMQYQVDRLRRRVANAEARKGQEVTRNTELLASALYPHGALQERVLGGLYFLMSQGSGLLADMHDSLQSTCPDHQILYL